VTFSAVYKNRRVLVTGHTGFKGSWLACWLSRMGAEITGVALAPDTNPDHWDLLKLNISADHRQDIRDASALAAIFKKAQPEIVFHLAAQPLVRRSYKDPLATWSTNVMGTAHVLEACRQTLSVKAIVSVATDKCYENLEKARAFREDDPLGGYDPYSASKAGAELVASSYRQSFFGVKDAPLLATARAGNVIGGGDWSEDRLIPDLVRAVAEKRSLVIRSPKATRPWQHVLEPLAGYLTLGQKLLQGDRSFAEAWNFGPDDSGNQTVETVLTKMKSYWPSVNWNVDSAPQPHEAGLLHLDSGKARSVLQWVPAWSLDEALATTAEWYKNYLEKKNVITVQQIDAYTAAAQKSGARWAA